MDRRQWLIGAAALGVPGSAAGGGPVEAPAAAMANAYLAVFNRGDAAAYAAFVKAHWPSSREKTADYLALRDQSGGFDLVRTETANATTLRGVACPRLADAFLRFELQLEPDDPQAIRLVSLAPTSRPADVPPPKRAPLRDVIAMTEQRIAAYGDFSGVALIAEGDRPVLLRAYGLADRDAGAPNMPGSVFRMASMGKMFTAVAVAQLVQSGKVRLDATVGQLLPDYPNQAFARTVTVEQLLSHTAGAGDFMGPRWAAARDRLRTLDDYVQMFGDRPPTFPPGSRFEYANFGYIVLGKIVEAAGGQSYADYLRDHVFAVAGMANTSAGAPPAGLAKAYVKAPDGYRPAPSIHADSPPTSAGGAYATASDLLAFGRALARGRLIEPERLSLFTTGRQPMEPGVTYGYGFMDFAGPAGDFGHTGGGPGANGALRVIGHGRYTVVVLSNAAPTWRADKLAQFIAGRLPLDG